jgi:Holliday junction resolvase
MQCLAIPIETIPPKSGLKQKEGFFLTRYAKGANAERELLQRLFENGFSVARVAGSGVSNFNPPDLLAFSKTKKLGFECKAWDSSSLTIPAEQFEALVSWCRNADCTAIFAWKVSREGWFFLSPNAFHKTGKAYAVSRHEAKQKGVDFGVLIGEQTQLSKR